MSAELMTSEIVLAKRPEGFPQEDDFRLRRSPISAPGPGEAIVRNIWMSVDPYMRGRMDAGSSYIAPFELGAPLTGAAVGQIIESNAEGWCAGDHVVSRFGWRTLFKTSVSDLTRIDDVRVPVQAYLGVLGAPGRSAWLGLRHFADISSSDVVYVSAAAGAVGQVACQIAVSRGCRVVGSAAGAEKVAFLHTLGVDAAIDYLVGDLADQLRSAAPDGISVYFDNVGGSHLDAALVNARPFARFVLCGMVGDYNAGNDTIGVHHLFEAVRRNISLRGFIVQQHEKALDGFTDDMIARILAGDITWRETIYDGLERAPEALIDLFRGANVGKMLVRLG